MLVARQSPVHLGSFAVEADRQECCRIVHCALNFKLEELAGTNNLNLYRYFAARYEDLLGQPRVERSLEDFLSHFKFVSLEQAANLTSGMSGAACAALAGDVAMLRRLVQAGGRFDERLPAMRDPYCFDSKGLLPSGFCNTDGAAQEILMQPGADANLDMSPGRSASLNGLCFPGAFPEAVGKLPENQGDVNFFKDGIPNFGQALNEKS